MTTEIKAADSRPVATVEKRKAKRAPPPKQTPPDTSKTFTHSQREDGSLKITAPDLAQLRDSVGEREYWVGALEDSPMQNFTVGGTCFPRWTNMPNVEDVATEDGKIKFVGGKPTLGQFIRLTDNKVASVIKKVQRLIVRTIGGNGHSILLNLDSQRYVPNPKTDRPLGEFIYMIRADQVTAGMAQKYPTPLIAPSKE